jgi:tRNA modification GTPase
MAAVQCCFHGKRALSPSSRLYHGTFHALHDDSLVDEVVVTCCEQSHSMTGESLVEIHCHGSRAVTAKIAEVLLQLGVQLMSQEDWHNCLTGYQTAIEQAALRRFLACESDLSACVLLYQMQGVLRQKLTNIRQTVASEPDVALAHMVQLIETATLGKALVTPPHIAIAGAPNVGKSTLLNLLLGRERAIVDASPGTTRDIISEPLVIQGMRFLLSDTAGIRTTDDMVEQLGVLRSQTLLTQADRVIWVCDAAIPPRPLDQPLSSSAIILVNKSDLAVNHLAAYRRIFPTSIATCALSGDGIKELEEQLLSPFQPFMPHTPAPIVFEKWQEELLANAADALRHGQKNEAMAAIEKMLL